MLKIPRLSSPGLSRTNCSKNLTANPFETLVSLLSIFHTHATHFDPIQNPFLYHYHKEERLCLPISLEQSVWELCNKPRGRWPISWQPHLTSKKSSQIPVELLTNAEPRPPFEVLRQYELWEVVESERGSIGAGKAVSNTLPTQVQRIWTIVLKIGKENSLPLLNFNSSCSTESDACSNLAQSAKVVGHTDRTRFRKLSTPICEDGCNKSATKATDVSSLMSSTSSCSCLSLTTLSISSCATPSSSTQM